ncbi:MAG: hypothetical protein RLZZ299_1329 [Pseudomonadota bacterium]|jgi:hypothetical protein
MRQSLPLAVFLLVACGAREDHKDTGDDTPTPDYDVGCILVDGGGGYAHLRDAVAAAPEGAEIEVCAGTYEEEDSVVIDKGIHLRGTQGVVLVGAPNRIPLVVTGAGARISGFRLESTRTGLKIDGAVGVLVENVEIGAAASWGVSVVNGADVALEQVTMLAPEGGGLEVRDSTAAVTRMVLDAPGGFGVKVRDSEVTLSDVTINGVVMDSDDLSDGRGIDVNGGSVTLSSVIVDMPGGVGLWAEDGAVTGRDVIVAGPGYMGAFGFGTTWDFERLEVVDAPLQGVYAEGASARFVDTRVRIAPDDACGLLYLEWGENGNAWCGGMLVASDTIELQGLDVGGYNNYALLAQPSVAASATLTLSDSVLSDTGRWGAYFYEVEGTVTNVAVQGLREPELERPCFDPEVGSWMVDRSAAFLVYGGRVSFTGGALQDNDGWGISNIQGIVRVDGTDVSGNTCSGVMNYMGALTVTGATFTGSAPTGTIWDVSGASVIEDSAFQDGHAVSRVTWTDGSDGSAWAQETSAAGADVRATNSASVVVRNNTFVRGDAGVEFNTVADGEVTDNSWFDYVRGVFTVYYASADNPATFSRNTVDAVGGPVVSVLYGEVEVEDVQVGALRPYSYTYTTYHDGTSQGASTITGTSPALSVNGGSSLARLSASDVDFGALAAGLAYVYEGALELDSVTVASAGGTTSSPLFQGTWGAFTPDLDVEDLTVGALTGAVANLSSSASGEGRVSFVGVDVASSAGDALVVGNVGALSLEDVVLGPVANGAALRTTASGTGTVRTHLLDVRLGALGTDGIVAIGGTLDVEGLHIVASGGRCLSATGASSVMLADVACDEAEGVGVEILDTTAGGTDADTVSTFAGVTIGAAETAVRVVGGTTTLSGVIVDGGSADGLLLSGARATVTDNVFRGLSGYGMVCESAVLDSCVRNDLSGNEAGPYRRCLKTCDDL